MNLLRIARAGTILASVGLLAHCAPVPPADRPAASRISTAEEIRIGAAAQRAVAQSYAVLDAPALQAHVDEMGQRLAAKAARRDGSWHFVVLDSPEVNAFSLPGGAVYVTRGLLAYLESDNQLAAVLAHEIAHVVARDGLHAAHAAGASTPQPALTSLLVPGADGSTRIGATGYGSAAERAADAAAAQLLARAGYAPHAIDEVRNVLQQQAQRDVAQAQAAGRALRRYHGVTEIAPQPPTPFALAREDDGYLRLIAGLAFDDSVGQRVVRGHAVLDAAAGFGIEFPLGWQIRIEPLRVVATSPQHDALIELRLGADDNDTLDALRRLALDPGAKFVGGKLDANAASFGAGTTANRPALVAAVAFGGTQLVIAGLCRDAAAYALHRDALKAAINSFHVLGSKARAHARPRTLHLVTANAATRIAALAAASGMNEAEFRGLNQLDATTVLRPGQVLKVVE